MQLVPDTRNAAVGGVLLQEDNDAIFKPIRYIDQVLTAADLKCSITENEAVSLKWCIEKLC